MLCRLLPQRRAESSGARDHGDGGGVVLLSFTADGHPHRGTVVVRSSAGLVCGPPPSPLQGQTESSHLNLLVLVYNLGKFRDPTRLYS
jgi:hypothetical protein